MPTPTPYRPTEQPVQTALHELGTFAAGLRWADLPPAAQQRLGVVLTDFFGVVVAGVRTPEVQALLAVWHPAPGPVRVPGSTTATTPETAAHVSAVAACVLELDEGNKHAAGHPAVHVVPAAVAAARLAGEAVDGERFLTAVVAGYEVAARFGRATRRDPRWHTHGHWGATGAACAATLLLGGGAREVAAAIDSASGLMQVTPWEHVLAGGFTRNLWAANAGTAGLQAARLALAGLVDDGGSAPHAFELLGGLEVAHLARGLGEEWLVSEGYLKRHAACSYTHAAVDLVQSLHAAGTWHDPDEVAEVHVRTTSLAGPLLRREPATRLAAMFSLPFVVATAVVSGRVDPASMTPGTTAFRAARALSPRVDVQVDPQLDAYLPDRRCTEVRVVLRDGRSAALAQPQPIGDATHFPLDADDVATKLVELVGPDDAARVAAAVRALPAAPAVAPVLDALP